MAAPVRKPRKGRAPMRITNKRLARLRVDDPNALPDIKAGRRYTTRERQQIREANTTASKKRQAAKATKKKAPAEYNPLAPLTGDRLRQERQSAERLEFGPKEAELRSAMGKQESTTRDRAGYYDDFRQAMREATARINESNRVNVEASQGRVDTAHAQDSAGLQARDAAAAEAAKRLGREAAPSAEGAQAVAAQRAAGNQDVATLRDKAGADNKYLELRTATAALKKAEDAGRQQSKAAQLRQEAKELATNKGAFRTDFERKTREGEREWAAVQQEFGLKEQDINLKNKNTVADRRIESQKVAAQKIVARIYASADKAKARAQVRVAKLQLEKGKIDQKQYREIVNTYKGLPAKGQSGGGGGGGSAAKSGKPGSGSGPGGSLAPWERDKVTNAVRVLERNKAKATDRKTWMKRMQDAGVPARLARIAWDKYFPRSVGSRYDKGNVPG